MNTIDFNCDLGEGFGPWPREAETTLIGLVSSANVAAGFHAGDPGKIRDTVEAARENGVAVGAHPGLQDLAGFGRRAMLVTPREVSDLVTYQLGAVHAFAVAAGTRLHHVKLHGALAMLAMDDADAARAFVEAVAAFDNTLPIYTSHECEAWLAAQRAGMRVVAEFYADRPLRSDGSVVLPAFAESFERQPAEAFEPTPAFVAKQVRSFLATGSVAAFDGGSVAVHAETVSVHADIPNVIALAKGVREGIEQAGFTCSSELAKLGVAP